MGDKVNKRERGLWSVYTPLDTPFEVKVNGKLYPVPSFNALKQFSKEVDDIQEYYDNGKYMFDADGYSLDLDDAIAMVHRRRYARWLERQDNN